ncbi:MAG: UDP-N-acetylmuramate dehydrogenase [Methylococcaceae bacterium]|nr:UDP-N-acetylmuramate dehydrogenase [Methylococcaceae bacterium]
MQVILNGSVAGELLSNESLANYTSWRVGGLAEELFIPEDKAGLCAFLVQLAGSKSLFWMGFGSNLLVLDGGIAGVVINTRGRLKQMALYDGLVYVEAGVPCPHVARFCAEQGLIGAEFLAGIPGTMGGALKMNAGAFEGSTWDLINSVETVDNLGVVRQRQAQEFKAYYRGIEGLGAEWFLAATLKLQTGDRLQSQEKIRQLLAKRAQSQPTNQPSCGSVFKNPEGDHAARLIEAAGLKGYCIGGACVSDKHANFIVNIGAATAADIEALIATIQQQVEVKYGIKLQTEVCRVGRLK